MTIQSTDLISELTDITTLLIKEASNFKSLSIRHLNQKKDDTSWSVLECIEHLNRYCDFYIPEIKYRIQTSNYNYEPYFKPGILGNYFSKSMKYKPKLNYMKTFKSMNPIGSNLSPDVITTFIEYQNQLLTILHNCKSINLTNTKTAVSISKLIKLRLGDTLRVVIYHNQRHVVQAINSLKNYSYLE